MLIAILLMVALYREAELSIDMKGAGSRLECDKAVRTPRDRVWELG